MQPPRLPAFTSPLGVSACLLPDLWCNKCQPKETGAHQHLISGRYINALMVCRREKRGGWMVGVGGGAMSSCRDKGQKLWITFKDVNFCSVFEWVILNQYWADRWRRKQDLGLANRQEEKAGDGVSVGRKQILPTRIQRAIETLPPQHQVELKAYRGFPLSSSDT